MTHQQQFKDFMLAVKDFDYVIFRGFLRLPELPDTDVDLTVKPEQYNDFCRVADSYLKPGTHQNYGYAEWCDMQYWPHFTTAPRDPAIPNKHQAFRLDFYNSLYFKSPLEDYTTFWTVSKRYFDNVLSRRRLENFYYLISLQDELTLTVCRGALDNQGNWKDKHKARVKELLNTVDKQLAIDSMSEVLPDAEKIYELLVAEKYGDIKWD